MTTTEARGSPSRSPKLQTGESCQVRVRDPYHVISSVSSRLSASASLRSFSVDCLCEVRDWRAVSTQRRKIAKKEVFAFSLISVVNYSFFRWVPSAELIFNLSDFSAGRKK